MTPRINAYLLAADPAWLEESIGSYYQLVDRIVVSSDISGRSWTGSTLPIDDCLARLKSLDPEGKLDFRPGDYARAGRHPMENETFQRQQALRQASDGADWVIQLDTDEVVTNPGLFRESLLEADAGDYDAFVYPARWLYQRVSPVLFLERSSRLWRPLASYPGPVAMRSGAELRHARQGGTRLYTVGFSHESLSLYHLPTVPVQKVISFEDAILHFSWIRSDDDIAAKLTSFGHADRDWSQPLRRWRRAAKHPLLTATLTPLQPSSEDRLRISRISGWDRLGQPMRDYAVVIPTHDRRRSGFLMQAVDSVLGQTLSAAEIIVVSDGPGDAVHEAMTGRPVTIVERPAGGEARARNSGIAASSSEWICFLDDDDLWHPDFLRTMDTFIKETSSAVAVNSSYWTFSSNGECGADLAADDLAGCLAAADKAPRKCDTSYMDIYGRSFELLLERNRGDIATTVVRRDIVEKAGDFLAEFTCAVDWLFFVNIARFAEWHYIPERLAFHRDHANRITKTVPTNGVETLRAIHHMWSEESLPTPAHRPLAEYGRDYRFHVQETLWGAIRARRLDLARDALSLGMPLLPNWRDRVYALTPRQLTWRVERGVEQVRAACRV